MPMHWTFHALGSRTLKESLPPIAYLYGVEQREQAMEEECWAYEHLISILDQSLLSCSSDCLINSAEYCLVGKSQKIAGKSKRLQLKYQR